MGERIVQVAAGCALSVAVTWGGHAYTWGWGFGGMLGHGDEENRLLPTRVSFKNGVNGCVSRRSITAETSLKVTPQPPQPPQPPQHAESRRNVEASCPPVQRRTDLSDESGGEMQQQGHLSMSSLPNESLPLRVECECADEKISFDPGCSPRQLSAGIAGGSGDDDLVFVTCAAASSSGTLLGTRSGSILFPRPDPTSLSLSSWPDGDCSPTEDEIYRFCEYWRLPPSSPVFSNSGVGDSGGSIEKKSNSNELSSWMNPRRCCWRVDFVGDLARHDELPPMHEKYRKLLWATVIDSAGRPYALFEGNTDAVPTFTRTTADVDCSAEINPTASFPDHRYLDIPAAISRGGRGDQHRSFANSICNDDGAGKRQRDQLPPYPRSSLIGSSANKCGGSEKGTESACWVPTAGTSIDPTGENPTRCQKRAGDGQASASFTAADSRVGAKVGQHFVDTISASGDRAVAVPLHSRPSSPLREPRPSPQRSTDSSRQNRLQGRGWATRIGYSTVLSSPARGGTASDSGVSAVFAADGAPGWGALQAFVGVTTKGSVVCSFPSSDTLRRCDDSHKGSKLARELSLPRESSVIHEYGRRANGGVMLDFDCFTNERFGGAGGVVCIDIFVHDAVEAIGSHGLILVDGGRSLLTWGNARDGQVGSEDKERSRFS